MKWIKIRSWHLAVIDLGDRYLTRCGRTVLGDTLSELPLDEKSCETCLRLAERD